MFKIESYITSIILANADRYIRNFRKEDAQVSLWGGDATFHNIDLNVDALNEEFNSLFVFTSGYIRDLTIHVPWTKLMSEPVAISVNTIECVMRLKTKDEKNAPVKRKTSEFHTSEFPHHDRKTSEEITPSASYSSTLTAKIMNNLAIRCENIILKLVEEDIVFSMNIEKLSFENVNEQWVQAITDINTEKLLTRKLLTLSGVTICLDKQNSSGRIETYLEPLLYRCLINIRLLRGYNRAISVKPIYTHMDILSDKMSFTICEPQLPMLFKLGEMLFSSNSGDDKDTACSDDSFALNTDIDTDLEKRFDDGQDETWGNWLWNMVPSILAQDNEKSDQFKEELNPTFNFGFCVKQLEINLKVFTYSIKKKSKKDFKNFLRSNFCGCFCQSIMKNNEWFNVQMGVSQAYADICDEVDSESQLIRIFTSGMANATGFIEETLFNEKFDFFALKMHQKLSYDRNDDVTAEISEAFKYSRYDFMYSIDFSVDTHLNLCTENFLLEKTPAFAIDYVKTRPKLDPIVIHTVDHGDENYENRVVNDSSQIDAETADVSQKFTDSFILLRFVFGSSVIKINPDAITRVMHLYKILSYNSDFVNYQQSVPSVSEKKMTNYYSSRTTQFTFFDFFVEFHPSPPPNLFLSSPTMKEHKFFDIPETYSFCHVTPILSFYCKCIDGSIKYNRNVPAPYFNDSVIVTSLKAVDLSCSTLLATQKYTLFKCGKFDCEYSRSLGEVCKELKLEAKNIALTASKPNLFLSHNIVKYLTCFIWQSEAKQIYYTNIFCTSLLDDLLLPNHTILEAAVENINILYQEIKDVYKIKLSINRCKVFASKMDDDGQKQVIIFSTAIDETGPKSSSLEMMLQRCQNCNSDWAYPSCFSFSFRNLKIYFDFIIYQWLLYMPVSNVKQKSHSKLNKSTKDTTVSKSVPSRKISDTSSGSHSRKYSTAYPKPRESVHSSSEPEVHSPLEITETDTSDLFHTAESVPIEKEPVSFIQRLADDVKNWSCLLIFGEISEINVYLPTIQYIYGKECADFDLFICQSLQNNAGHESSFGVFQFYLKSVKLKCDVVSGVSEMLNSSSFITVSKDGGSANRLTFPWTISVADISVYTLLENNINQLLLKPLFMNSTIGVSFRDGSNKETVINLCVHLDFQPVVLCLDTKQASLITNICETFRNICRVYEQNATASSFTTERLISASIMENSETDLGKTRNRLTGWIQWTFTKCSVEFYNIVNEESTRLLMQIEDSIISLEFDDVYHKLKTKVASFGMYHQSRHCELETWQNGRHNGVILQRCYRQLASSGKVEEEDSEDRFLLVTVTRARSSNLRARLSLVPDSSVSPSSNSFVTEIVVKMSPLDIILPLAILEKFLAVVKPFIHFYRAPRQTMRMQPESNRVDSEMSIAYLPLVYFDIPMLRIFVPISMAPVDDKIVASCDTLVCEVGSIHAHCHPENPVARKPLNPEVYYSIAGTKYAPVEQKLRGQQYQLHIADVSVNTGIWKEIEQMLIKEQISVEKPPSILEQNPAVMWNQGCHPDSKNRIDLKHLSPIISKFSTIILVAPPIEYNFLSAAVYGAYFEFDVVTEINVFLSLHQIPFFVSLCKEYIEYICPYFLPPEKEVVDSTTILMLANIIPTRLIDSGIESMEQSSVGSSSFSKIKNPTRLPILREISSKTAGPNILSNLNQLPATTFKKDIFREVYVTAQSLCFTVYATSVEKTEDGTSRNLNRALLHSEITQPHFLMSDENNSFTVRVGGFSSTIYVPSVLYRSLSFPEIPTEKKFYTKLLCIRALRCDRYSRIKNEGYSFKAIRSMNNKWKIDCAIDQPIFIDFDVSVIKHLLSVANECLQEYKRNHFSSPCDFTNEPTSNEKRDNSEYLNKIRVYFTSISGVHVHTNRIVTIFKSKNTDRGLFLNADSTKIEVWSPHNIKNSIETVKVQCQVNAITVSLPNIRNRQFWSNVFSYNQFTALGFEKEEILSTLVLKPWNIKVDYSVMWQRWNLFKENPWKRIKLNCDSVHFHLNPSYVNAFLEIASNYSKYFAEFNQSSDGEAHVNSSVNNERSELYKDDLRAGAFQYIKREHDDRDLSAYEVVFCNRQIQPYMCWKYPQPRKLTKLQIYPVLVEDTADDYFERCLRCQLQYFNEITNSFHQYVSFNLSKSTIQNVTLPDEKPHMVAAECWRIVIFEVAHPNDGYDFKIDVKWLAGCVRVDSVFLPSLIANLQVLLNISEIQVSFFVINELNGRMLENFSVLPSPDEQLFLTMTCNDLSILYTAYDTGKIVKISGIHKARLLNYEYLMLQSFVDPFFAETVLHIDKESRCQLACIIKNFHLRVSPNFIHTLTVAQNLWNGWQPGIGLPCSITTPYIICNNMNHSVVLRQENTNVKSSLHLPPFTCHLFAWYNPMAPKNLVLTITSGKKEFVSQPFNIKRIGCHAVTCVNKEGELCLLFVSVIKHSSVVRQVIIQGSLLIYNLTNCDMDLCVVSYGKEAKSKLTPAHAVTRTSFTKNQLLSVILPLQHKLSFKIRYGSNANDAEQGHWSGLIPLMSLEKPCNQTSWMVKIPLKNHKEHFQSFWCQLTWEVIEEMPKYLVVFRPLCSITSFLPWKIHVKIFNELGSVISSSTVSDKGMSTDLFIPDTVSLNNYAIECTMSENSEKCLSRKKFPSCEKRKSIPKELRIPSLVDEIVNNAQNSNWPFLNIDTTRIQWKTNQIHEIKPIIKIKREEENGCGTKIEIFPWALIVNTFSCSVLWNISDKMYSVDCSEIVSPPCIEGTFKLGLVDNDQNFLSGTLQLADDQSFPIPKVTGRIPMNGFVTTMIDCGDYVSYLNITSKNYEETRIINTCSSYVINNNSNINISYSAWVVCRTGDKTFTSFDIPPQLQEKSVNLMASESSTIGQSISKWHKIGNGDIQVLPYLILSVDGNTACPIRLCDLSEKQRYPIIFSSSAHSCCKNIPCVFITAQQCEGQVFLTIWEETSPLITIHNTSQLSLNVISSKSNKGVEGISYLSDWNWKFCVASNSVAHFLVNRQFSANSKKDMIFLLFSVESGKPLKQTKWSYGVQLKPCRSQLVTLPLSQRHIKLSIFKDGFTYMIWIKSATADEVSAKMIRNRLSESFLPVSSSVIPTSTSQEDTNIPIENDDEVPEALVRACSSETIKFGKTNIFVGEFTCTIACEDDTSLEESDLVSFNAKKLFLNFSSLQKPNEVTEDIVCKINIESYQILNEEYHLRTFDFPVILLCKPSTNELDYKNVVLENLFLDSDGREDAALIIKIALKIRRSFECDIRDVEVFVNSLNGYLEDKYVLKLRSAFESIFSATIESSTLIQNHHSSPPSDRPIPKKISVSTSTSFNHDTLLPEVLPAKAKSSSSKSVNVSECGTDYSFKSLTVAEAHAQNDDDLQKPTPIDNSSECSTSASGTQTTPGLNTNCCIIPQTIAERSRRIAKPLRLRNICISHFTVTVSVRTSTTFYIAVDRSPLKFSEFKKEFLVTTPFELGNMLVVHYFMGAVYGTGWAISSLEFVGSPGVLARDLGTGIKDFVSMPLYGIATGPRGFVLGVAHGSASLMKHVMTGTLSSVTNFAGSWARTLNRFTLDADDLLQAEQIRRVPPTNIAEGILQGLSEFGISLLGGISGIAHHPLQYAISNSSDRSLLNSISLGIVGVLTRPISGAAELVARTGQGILSHVGWNMIPVTPSSSTKLKHFSTLQICDLKYHWRPEFVGVVFTGEAVDAKNLSQSLWVLVTATTLHIVDAISDNERCRFDFMSYEFKSSEQDPTLIVIERPLLNARNAVDFSKARIYKFLNDTNRSLNIESFHLKENIMYLERNETIFSFCVNPRVKNSLLNFIRFLKNMQD